MPVPKHIRKQYSRAYYLAHTDEVKARVKAWRKSNPALLTLQRKRYAQKHKAKIKARAAVYNRLDKVKQRGKASRWALFLSVVKAYGGRCACCAERNPFFLTIDHKKNDGARQRQTVEAGRPIYKWLSDRGFPKRNHQLLCWNCNSGRHRNGGVCPHKASRGKR